LDMDDLPSLESEETAVEEDEETAVEEAVEVLGMVTDGTAAAGEGLAAAAGVAGCARDDDSDVEESEEAEADEFGEDEEADLEGSEAGGGNGIGEDEQVEAAGAECAVCEGCLSLQALSYAAAAPGVTAAALVAAVAVTLVTCALLMTKTPALATAAVALAAAQVAAVAVVAAAAKRAVVAAALDVAVAAAAAAAAAAAPRAVAAAAAEIAKAGPAAAAFGHRLTAAAGVVLHPMVEGAVAAMGPVLAAVATAAEPATAKIMPAVGAAAAVTRTVLLTGAATASTVVLTWYAAAKPPLNDIFDRVKGKVNRLTTVARAAAATATGAAWLAAAILITVSGVVLLVGFSSPQGFSKLHSPAASVGGSETLLPFPDFAMQHLGLRHYYNVSSMNPKHGSAAAGAAGAPLTQQEKRSWDEAERPRHACCGFNPKVGCLRRRYRKIHRAVTTHRPKAHRFAMHFSQCAGFEWLNGSHTLRAEPLDALPYSKEAADKAAAVRKGVGASTTAGAARGDAGKVPIAAAPAEQAATAGAGAAPRLGSLPAVDSQQIDEVEDSSKQSSALGEVEHLTDRLYSALVQMTRLQQQLQALQEGQQQLQYKQQHERRYKHWEHQQYKQQGEQQYKQQEQRQYKQQGQEQVVVEAGAWAQRGVGENGTVRDRSVLGTAIMKRPSDLVPGKCLGWHLGGCLGGLAS
jgi:hypothetical protein